MVDCSKTWTETCGIFREAKGSTLALPGKKKVEGSSLNRFYSFMSWTVLSLTAHTPSFCINAISVLKQAEKNNTFLLCC